VVEPARYVNEEWMDKNLAGTKVVASGEVAIEDKGDHSEIETEVGHDELGKGVYLVLVCDHPSFQKGSHHLAAGFVNVTDLVLVGTPGPTGTTRDRVPGLGGWQGRDGDAGRRVQVLRHGRRDGQAGPGRGPRRVQEHVQRERVRLVPRRPSCRTRPAWPGLMRSSR